MSRKEWTETEINKLIELYPKAPYSVLESAFLPRTRNSLQHKATRLGLQRKVPHWLTDFRMRVLSDLELGYLAGFTDGEGCIGMHKDKRGVYAPYLFWASTNDAVMARLRELLGESILHSWQEIRSIKGWKNITKIGVRGQDRIRQVLEALEPYLIIKRDQARLLLEVIRNREQGGARRSERDQQGRVIRGSITNTDKGRLEEIYQELKKLNKRGIPETGSL